MQGFLTTTLLLLLLTYLVALLILRIGLFRLERHLPRRRAINEAGEWPTVSIVVAARNEAQNLPRLIRSLVNQRYAEGQLEICIVDDNSEDGSWEILTRAMAVHPHLKAIRVEGSLPRFAPKKRALDRGIRATSGEILLFTDADCTPPPGWAREMVSFYEPETSVVIGYSPYRFDGPIHPLLKGMLSLEFFSVAAVAACSTGLGTPLTAAGCNLSYRRTTYFSVGGFRSISQWISGDDDLFVLKVSHERFGKISYALSPLAFVPGAAPQSWQKFWNQRIRYASKGRHYKPGMTAGLVAVYLLSLGILLGSASLLFGPSLFGFTALAAWLAKSLAEFWLLHRSARGFKEDHHLKYFLPTALLHPAYILLFGFLGLIARFEWKDKSFSTTEEITQESHDD